MWAKHWYGSVHASTKFAPYRSSEAPFPERLEPLLEECRGLYERLAAYAVQV